jgi:hypothetical protein
MNPIDIKRKRVGIKHGSIIYIQAAILAATGIKLSVNETIRYLFEEHMITRSTLGQLVRVDLNRYGMSAPVKSPIKPAPYKIYPTARPPEERWDLLQDEEQEIKIKVFNE